MIRYEEKWDLSTNDVCSLFPAERIGEHIKKELSFNVIFDDKILKKDVMAYNMPVFARAHNEGGLAEKLRKNNLTVQDEYMRDISLRDILGIRLPQVIISDNLGYKEKVMSLHFVKLRKDEYFINDLVMKRNPIKYLKNGFTGEVINNLIKLAEKNNIRYISGYATNEITYKIFVGYGFRADERVEYGNDKLMIAAKSVKGQYPFYIDLRK